MNRAILSIILFACIIFNSVNSGGDISGLLKSQITCAKVDCDTVYKKYIKEENPFLKDGEINRILTAVKYFNPRYFHEDPENGVEFTLAIMAQESSFRDGVMGDCNEKQCDSYSLMQIQIPTAEKAAEYNGIKRDVNLMQMWDNIHLGMANLNFLHERYEGNWQHAVMAYNRGHENVDKLIKYRAVHRYITYWNEIKMRKYRIHNIKEGIYEG